MNDVRPKIEIFRPFGEAFELTNKILFQPFDLKKWFVIGFAAFLSGHLAGVGFNFPSPFGNFQSHRTTPEVISPHFEQWKPWLVVAVVVLALLFFALVIALTWLKARGNFIFTDCVVRNQAAIVEPWREYRKEGNSYFLFLLAVMFAVLLLAGLMLASVIGLGWLKPGAGETGSITSIGFLVFLWCVLAFDCHFCEYRHLFHGAGDVPEAMSSSRGVSRCNASDMASPGLFLFALLVWDCFDSGCADDWRDRDMRDLLHGCASLRWDSYIAAIVRLLARIRARVSSPVRSGLRRVGEFRATGIFADLIRSAACAAGSRLLQIRHTSHRRLQSDKKRDKV